MEYPEDLSFTAKEIGTITIKESKLYKSLKKKIWEANQNGLRKLSLCPGFWDATAKLVLRQLSIEGFDIYKEDCDNDTSEVLIRWQNMKYPEDLTFTAEFLKDNPITVRDTTLYKDVKKAIWNNYSKGLHQYRCTSTWYEFKENELDVLEILREEGFNVMINTESNLAFISWREEETNE